MNEFPNYFGTNTFQRPEQPRTNNESNLENNQRMLNDMTYMYRNLTQTTRDVMVGYNTAINNYNQNISRFLSTMSDYRRDIHVLQNQLFNNRETRVNTNNISTSTTTESTDTNARRRNRSNFRFPLFRNNVTFSNLTPAFDDVIVRPSLEQINNSTEILVYNTNINLVNTRCPITMEDFSIGDSISRIRYCGHTFHEDSINSWFRSNVRCPVCRYDIRDYPNTNNASSDISSNNTTEINENTNDPTDTEISNDIINQLTNQLTTLFTSAMENQINNNDISQNRVFTFDIPITVTSINESNDDDDDYDDDDDEEF